MQTRIRHFRKLRGLTLEELGNRIGMSTGNLSKLERGLIPYDQYALESIARELGCRPAELLDNVHATSSRDNALLDILHSLSEEEQERFLRMAKVYAEPPASPAPSKDIEYRQPGFSEPTTLHEGRRSYRTGRV